jgi:hypothetical protein
MFEGGDRLYRIAIVHRKPRRPESVADQGAKYSRQQAAEHVAAQIRSGLTAKAYCERHGINYNTFHSWKRSVHVVARLEELNIGILPRRRRF